MASREFEEADREAIACTNDGSLSWKEAHEQWTMRTGKELSPHSFGQRIVERGGGNHVKTPTATPHPPHPPPTASPGPGLQGFRAANAPSSSISRTLPPIQPQRAPFQSRSPTDAIDVQRNDLYRLEGMLQKLDQRVADMETILHRLRYDLEAQSSSNASRGDPGPAIEMLSNTVSSMTRKTGEIDGIQVQLELLKTRLNKLEGSVPPHPLPATAEPTTTTLPYQPHPTYHQSNPAAPTHPPPEPHNRAAADSWNPNNSLKRKPTMDNSPVYEGYGSQKRSKSTTRDSVIMYDINANAMAGKNKPVAPYPPPPGADAHAPSQHLPPLGTLFNEPAREPTPAAPPPRRPGRPRKYASPGPVAPDMDKQRQLLGDHDREQSGYFHTFGGAVYGAAGERGRIIRRGSGGGSGGSTFMGIVEKKTRQRPVRNAEGILIRKDGKPDQRSISSPMNLKKVHAKKMAEMDSTGGSATGSPLADTARGHSGSNDEGSDYGDDDYHSTNGSFSNHPTPPSQHSKVMGKMFPNGYGDDARRMDHASHLFNVGPKPGSTERRVSSAGKSPSSPGSGHYHLSSEHHHYPKSNGALTHSPKQVKDESSPAYNHPTQLPTPAASEANTDSTHDRASNGGDLPAVSTSLATHFPDKVPVAVAN